MSISNMNLETLSQAGRKLFRLVQLHSILPEKERMATIREYLSLNSLQEVPNPRVAAIFYRDMEGETTVDKLQNFLREFGFLVSAPAIVARRALMGTTLLISPCLGTFEAPLDGVVKWVSSTAEIAIQPFYQAFAHCFDPKSDFSCGFRVPASAFIDFEKGLYKTENGKQTILTKNQATEIRQLFLGITSTLTKKKIANSKLLMLLEKIPGENFLDFAVHRYASLSRFLKEKLFERLGRLAMLDLLSGNLDRLVQAYHNADKGYYQLDEAMEVQLGNFMVIRQKEDIALFAIDNEMYSELIDKHRQQYLLFLKTLFSEKGWVEKIAKNIVKCFNNAFEAQLEDEEDHSLQEGRQALSAIKEDLKTAMPFTCLCKGLRNMARAIQTEFLPKYWDAEKIAPLKERLCEARILNPIVERFQLFQTVEIL